MNTYGRSGFKGSSSLPWAAFISFVDSHEDTMTLISYLDEMFLNFLQSIDLSNTAVIFSSDHGLHYGPAFASNGKRERAEPILYMYLPPSMNADMSTLEVNKELWVTPYDVHETILDVSLGAERKADQIGSSLLHPLPHNRAKCHETPGIPDRFCSLLNGPKKNNKNKKCTMMREPPSVHSFYSDIIQMNRPSWPKCKMTEEVVNLETEECLCSTNIYPIRTSEYWIPCNSSRFEEIDAVREAKADPLRMKTCKLKGLSEYIMDINITVTPRQKTSEERQMIRGEIQKELNADVELEVIPNILFIEIDALSRSGAMRNLPKTMSLLQSHQIRTIEENEALHCPTGFCAGIFNKTSIIGQNSIPNQLAALSGCTSQNMTDTDFYPRKPVNDKGGRLKLWCPKSDIENPWFYTITKNLGYITFFGEEICFKASPFVVQNRYFWLDTDYTMDQLFCQLAQADRDQQEISKDEKTLFAVEYDTSQNPQPCVDGKSRQELAFEYIRGIWNTYTESPKFAYLSSGAAHDYSIDLAYQSLGIEAYDEYLSNFLEEMLGRSDAKDTVIILRSDHGLQGGPSAIDFSTQVEHMNPFNSLIVPEKFRGGSFIDSLFANQDKLVTGYDLYNTMRSIVTPHTKGGGPLKDSKYTAGIPDFSYNLLTEEVPGDRSCEDARVPVEFCPCLEERTDVPIMPHFYVGHAGKQDQMENDVNFTTVPLDDGSSPARLLYEAIMVPGRATVMRRGINRRRRKM